MWTEGQNFLKCIYISVDVSLVFGLSKWNLSETVIIFAIHFDLTASARIISSSFESVFVLHVIR